VSSEHCPRCGYPQYLNGICLNNDCNFPNYKSNNELARERAQAKREEEARAQEEAAHEQRERARKEAERKAAAARDAKKSSSAVPAGKTSWSWLAAVISAVAAAAFASAKWGLDGGGLVVAAVVAGVLGGRFYKPIIATTVLVVIGWAVISSREAPVNHEVETPRVQPEKYSVVCLRNDTEFRIQYAYAWGDEKTQLQTLEPKGRWRFSYPESEPGLAVSTRSLRVQTDADLLPDYQEMERRLPAALQPTNECHDVYDYVLVHSAGRISIASTYWIPNWPHPFAEGWIASSEQGKWVAAPGYSLARVGDTSVALKEGEGIVGMRLQRKGTYSEPVYEIGSVTPQWPASARGLRAGLQIVAVDGTNVGTLTLDELSSRLRGPVGTTVVVNVRDQTTNQAYTVELPRERVR
jgi:hypothetical protein